MTNRNMSFIHKNKIAYVIVIAVVAIVGLSTYFSYTFKSVENIPITVKTVQIGGAVIRVELATTKAEQVLGLSGRTSLATSTGLLFVFDHDSAWGIWMKDMNFPIDVLWITKDLKVSDIVENMLPASYPKTYMPHVPVRYVLEVPAGTVESAGIKIGQTVVLK